MKKPKKAEKKAYNARIQKLVLERNAREVLQKLRDLREPKIVYTPELVLDLIEKTRKRGIEEGRAMERTIRDENGAVLSWTYSGLRVVPEKVAALDDDWDAAGEAAS